MAIINTMNERWRSAERSERAGVQDAHPIVRLTPPQAEELFDERRDMLASTREHIGAALYEALCAKIEYEHTSLLKMIDADAKVGQERTRLNKVLRSDYFVQKPLEANLV
jgi:hypothetical protein